MAFFCSQLLTFILEKEKESGSFSFLPMSRSACVHASIPIPLGLPPLGGKNCLCSCLSPALASSFRFLKDLLYTYPFSFTASDFLLLHYSCQHAAPVSKTVVFPVICHCVCMFLFLEILLRAFSVLFPTGYLLFLVSSPHS